MLDTIGDLEDALLRHETLHLVAPDDVAFLQRLDREVLARVLVLRQYHLSIASRQRHMTSQATYSAQRLLNKRRVTG